MDHALHAASASIVQLAAAVRELAAALGPETQRMSPAAQAALDLLLHDSRRIARRLSALDAQTPSTSTP